MLTADLVDVRRRGEELLLVAFAGERRALAAQLSAGLVRTARACVGESREEVEAALATVEAPARARRLLLGLRKILDDHSAWQASWQSTREGEATLDPAVVRRAVFERASVVRRELSADQRFDRDAVLDEVARSLSTDREALERTLFADLKSAEVLRAVELAGPDALVELYERQRVQAVLLRAVSVRVRISCDSPGAYRAIFRQVKFLRLLHVLRPGEDGGYELEIDGPFSLFESVTKYGLQLAMLLPALSAVRRFVLDADVRWGKGEARKSLRFRHEGGGGALVEARPLGDDAQLLFDALRDEGGPWRATISDAILELAGVGLCVPDLALTHADTGEVVYVELLGFWSREAVWKRKALVDQGLSERIVFVVSSHLRVSEELLEDDGAGALYVYKRVPSARVLLERVESLAARRVRSSS